MIIKQDACKLFYLILSLDRIQLFFNVFEIFTQDMQRKEILIISKKNNARMIVGWHLLILIYFIQKPRNKKKPFIATKGPNKEDHQIFDVIHRSQQDPLVSNILVSRIFFKKILNILHIILISRVLFFFIGGRFWCTSKITPTKIIEGRSQKEKRSRTRIWSFLRRWIWLYATYEIKRGVQPVWIWANWTCTIFGAKVIFQHWSGKVFYFILTVLTYPKWRNFVMEIFH